MRLTDQQRDANWGVYGLKFCLVQQPDIFAELIPCKADNRPIERNQVPFLFDR